MARLLTYNYFINKYIFNNQICKYNNSLPNKPKSFIFNNADDVKNFIHYHHVKNHDFGDLSLADEIVINDGAYNKTWLIAGFNTQLDTDVNNGAFGKHHLVLIPKKFLFGEVRIHDRLNNSQGFVNTEMFNITLPEINKNLSNILQNHLLEHKTMLSIDNCSKLKPYTVKSMLLNYCQAFGNHVPYQHYYQGDYETSSDGIINVNNDDDVFQMPLFKQDVKYRTVYGFYWWLRNIYKPNYFSMVFSDGRAGNILVLYRFSSYVIRPFICIG